MSTEKFKYEDMLTYFMKIGKNELEKLYWKERKSLCEIAKKFHINSGTLYRLMKKYKIPTRNKEQAQKKRRKILTSKKRLYELYWKRKKSLKEIASLFNVSSQAISYWMKKFNIKKRTSKEVGLLRKKVKLSPSELYDLYWKQRRSINIIAKDLRISPTTVRKKMIEFDIPRRDRSESCRKYKRHPFSGNKKEKFYLIGFSLGDLHVAKRYQTITVLTTTTHPALIELFFQLFNKYGHCQLSPKRGTLSYEWSLRCQLDLSFNFLLSIPRNFESDEEFYSFLAGYSDAEGWWGVRRSHSDKVSFIFELQTMDKKILSLIKVNLEKRGFHPKFGFLKNRKLCYIRLLRKDEVVKLAEKLLHFSKHKEKREKMKMIIKLRNKNSWKEIKNIVEAFNRRIKEEVKMCKEMAEKCKKLKLKVGLES